MNEDDRFTLIVCAMLATVLSLYLVKGWNVYHDVALWALLIEGVILLAYWVRLLIWRPGRPTDRDRKTPTEEESTS